MIETGSASAGMIVAVTFRRKMKITMITSAAVSSRVNCTSLTELRIETERSSITPSFTEAGNCASNTGNSAFTESTTWTVLESGWRWMPRRMPRSPFSQLATRSFSTLSTAVATSLSFTGAPLR